MELGPKEKYLIAVARAAHAPNETQRTRVRKGLDAKLAAGLAAPLLATSSAMAMVGKVGAGVAILTVLGTTAAYVTTSDPGHEAAKPQARLRSTPARPPVAEPVPAPVPPTSVEPRAPAPNDSPAGAGRPRIPSVRRAASPAAPPDLASELAFLTQVSNAAKRGDLARAEHLLAEYDRQFPSAQLAEERAAAGILLACAAGRTASARAQAGRFFEHWPRSPLVARINSSCIAEVKTP